MFRSVLHTMTIAAGVLLGRQAALAENRHRAGAIGQSAYRAVTPLPNPANDARARRRQSCWAMPASTWWRHPISSQNELREKVGDFACRDWRPRVPTPWRWCSYAAAMRMQIDEQRISSFRSISIRNGKPKYPAAGGAAQRRAQHAEFGAEQNPGHSARRLPQQSVSRHQRHRRPRSGDRRCQGRRRRHLRVLFDLAGRRSRRRQWRRQPRHHGAAPDRTGARAFHRGGIQAGAAFGQPGHRGPADALGFFLADQPVQFLRIAGRAPGEFGRAYGGRVAPPIAGQAARGGQ